MVNVIGILGAVASVFTILDSAFNNVPKGRNSLVSVRAALDKKDGSGTMRGKIGWIRTWNNNQDKLGEESNRKIGTGGLIEVQVSQKSGQQATYVSLHATNDAVMLLLSGLEARDMPGRVILAGCVDYLGIQAKSM